ncbi:MAG: 50S ribosomal protein L28 [Bacteroidetes bacterium]|nr:50S ribosomal protein L28 [Bacteroidota bacterium]
MSRVCQITGARPATGNRISHSNRKTKRRFFPNLMKRRFFVPEAGKWITLKISASGIKTIDKKGLTPCLREAYSKGLLPKKVVHDLKKIILN